MIKTILITLGFGALMGLVIGIFSVVFEVKEDPLIAKITELLPGYNCGGCGYPGCSGFASALVGKEVNKISTCRPCQPQQKEAIKKAFDETPNQDGVIIEVEI